MLNTSATKENLTCFTVIQHATQHLRIYEIPVAVIMDVFADFRLPIHLMVGLNLNEHKF
jgi:hypothetical protein